MNQDAACNLDICIKGAGMIGMSTANKILEQFSSLSISTVDLAILIQLTINNDYKNIDT